MSNHSATPVIAMPDTPGIRALIIMVAVVLVLSWLFSLPVMTSMDWYDTLQKPSFTPPSWSFGVVWPLLYIMMTVAAWLVWRRKPVAQEQVEEALALFIFQLVVNYFWTIFFFGAQSPWLGLLWILLVWFLVGLTIIAFQSVHKLAALLLLPYFAWVNFAALLTWQIWKSNL